MAKTTQERLDYAKQLVINDPKISKRGLQNAVKGKFGIGLSDSNRRSVLQRANTPGVLRSRIATYAFTSRERKELRGVIKSGNPSYLKDVVNARYGKYREMGEIAKSAGLTFKEFLRNYRSDVKQEAKGKGWIITKTTAPGRERGRRVGQIDIFKMLKDFRDKSIQDGDYDPKEWRKAHTSLKDIKAQDGNYQERQTAKSNARERERIKSQISTYNYKIEESTGEVRRNLEFARANLRKRLSNLR